LQRDENLTPKIKHVLQNYFGGTPDEKNQLLKSVIKHAFYYKSKNSAPKDYIIDIELRENFQGLP
jgi:hypothetical protein